VSILDEHEAVRETAGDCILAITGQEHAAQNPMRTALQLNRNPKVTGIRVEGILLKA
jgi:hypothetical protein